MQSRTSANPPAPSPQESYATRTITGWSTTRECCHRESHRSLQKLIRYQVFALAGSHPIMERSVKDLGRSRQVSRIQCYELRCVFLLKTQPWQPILRYQKSC